MSIPKAQHHQRNEYTSIQREENTLGVKELMDKPLIIAYTRSLMRVKAIPLTIIP
jgi:hypothetical protein